MYNILSEKPEEFINHEEILDTLEFAEKNKHNAELIDQIIEKAKLRKGLTHRDALVLLDCDIEEKIRKFTPSPNKSKKIFTAIVSLCLHRFIFPTIV